MAYNYFVEEFRDDEYPMMKGKQFQVFESVDTKVV
jgi:hypothetical protein